jgi:hypothetical protein
MEHLNRSHHRTFTLIIFRMNAQELIEITRRVNDPDEGIRLMAVDNREAGQQTHREVTRRAHNFVAAALTLVEHMRIFMRENYSGTPILDRYQTKIGFPRRISNGSAGVLVCTGHCGSSECQRRSTWPCAQ